MVFSEQSAAQTIEQAKASHHFFTNERYLKLPWPALEDITHIATYSMFASDYDDSNNVIASIEHVVAPLLGLRRSEEFAFCVGEAIHNAQQHSYNYAPDKKVDIVVHLTKWYAMAAVTSIGTLDVEKIHQKIEMHKTLQSDERGRGYHYMTELCDGVFINTKTPFIDIYLFKVA